jgi:acyl-CoA reductase-like NAD-dependent aldehyde dehydrogenase
MDIYSSPRFMSVLISTNPAAAFLPLGEVHVSTDSDIIRAALDARTALPERKHLGVAGRVRALRRVFEIYIAHEEELATLITKEVGKPILQSKFDLATDKEYFGWYLDNAESILSPRTTYEDENELHRLFFEPLGVAVAISPRNFPSMLFVRQVIPLLLAGNTVLFKHSHECPLVGKLLQDIFQAASIPH